MFGVLEPSSQGEAIQLLKERIRIGRRDGNDVVLNFANVSSKHALMELKQGYWFIRDLDSRNGVFVDGKRISTGWRKRLNPGVTFAISKHEFVIEYNPTELGAYAGVPPADEKV